MKRNIFLAGLVATIMPTMTACSSNGNGDAPFVICPSDGLQLKENQVKMTTGQNTFAWRMFNEVSKAANGKSFVCSPLSMVYCLGMVNAGAVGSTSDEITTALNFDSGADDINQYCKTLMKQMPNLDNTTTFDIANCVEVNKPYTLLSDYKATVKNSYNALVESRNFGDASFKDYINGWVNKHTNGMITKLFDDINSEAAAYIVNAIYFKGVWASKFDKALTTKDDFNKANGSAAKVDMMHQTNSYSYTSGDIYQAVGLDYGNGAYSMQILLPNTGKTVSDVMTAMQGCDWRTFIGNMHIKDVALSLPKFSVEYGGDMNNTLKQLGITTMFTPQADFSKLCDKGLFVSRVIQKAKIEVNEEGAKAAAATGVEMVATAIENEPEIIEFCADRPFIYVITEKSSGTICFIGVYEGE